MAELKVMYLMEISMNKYGLWHNFKPIYITILSNIDTILIILSPRL